VWAATPVAAPAVDSFALGHRRGAGAARFGVFGKTFAGAPGKIMVDLNFDDVPPLGTPEEVEVSGGAHHVLFVVQVTARDFHLAIRPDPRPEAGHYLPFGSFQPGARGRAVFFDQ